LSYYTQKPPDEALPDFAWAGLENGDFKPPKREQTIVSMVERCISQGIRGRTGLSFEYLVRMTYADGHRMLTVGGLIADQSAREKLSGDGLSDLWFLSRGAGGSTIHIPRLVFTPKEVTVLEQHFPDGTKVPRGMGISLEDVELLRRFYKYWPSYMESLV
jgi:hypothetical protein